MEVTNTKKELYDAPETDVIEVKSEGIICASDNNGQGHGYGGWD